MLIFWPITLFSNSQKIPLTPQDMYLLLPVHCPLLSSAQGQRLASNELRVQDYYKSYGHKIVFYDSVIVCPKMIIDAYRAQLRMIEAKKLISSRHVAIATKLFLDNAAIDPGNHHTKFEICPIYC